MRITARLDEKDEGYLYKIQQANNFKSITAVLKYALKHTAEHQADKQDGQKMKGFLASNYIGAFEGPENLSADYKSEINSGLEDKHDHL